MSKSYEDMFLFMKGLGYYKDCADYGEYRIKHLGITKAPDEMKEEEHQKEFNAWLDEMSPKERSQFEDAFGDPDPPCE